MGTNTLGRNITLPIYNADGTSFNELELTKFTSDSVVMSLADKITGDVYYKDNGLSVAMTEYVLYNGVKYVLVNPPTVVREGMVADNSQHKGMTKYSFVFYHPMYVLANFPFTDAAVSSSEEKFKSQDKTFTWIGNLADYVAKLNKNLQGTQWIVGISSSVEQAKIQLLSDVLTFDKVSIADALKTGYNNWEVPYIIDTIKEGEQYYDQGKRFLIIYGLPSNEIYEKPIEGHDPDVPFVFKFGQGVGLKNNSRTPRNNKIITRLAGYGSEDNIPYGYPQIIWNGNQSWDYTINNDANAANSYPIYDGIVGGQRVRLIKHPFTRSHLMPSIYTETVNKKVNPYASGYNPNTEIIDYIDADGSYPNPLKAGEPSYESHEFEKIKPQLGNASLVNVEAYGGGEKGVDYIRWNNFVATVNELAGDAKNEKEAAILTAVPNTILTHASTEKYTFKDTAGSYIVEYSFYKDNTFIYVKYVSDTVAFEYTVLQRGHVVPSDDWDDTMDDDGNYVQSYFKVTLPQLSFDLYASAAATQEMSIYMRTGACIGCTFPVQVDWEDYKKNFYKPDGSFDPVIHNPNLEEDDGHVRDGEKYPDSSAGQITVLCKKENTTYGVLMPNVYQKPASGDKFAIIGISLPLSYISTAEGELDTAMAEYLAANNEHYFDYPLKFDEYFLATHTYELAQIKPNAIVRFQYAGVTKMLYVKQLTVKYGDKVLPQYDITLTDDIEIVVNEIGQTVDGLNRLRAQVNGLEKYYGDTILGDVKSKLSRIVDDVCQGRITFQQGLDSIGMVFFHDTVQSPDFVSGLYGGKGWRIDKLGNAELESLRVRSFLEVVELLINRLQAQEGDTVFSDNDQIDYVEKFVDEETGVTYYTLSLKEKYDGYITGQMYGNVIKGIINTLAAKQAGVSDYESSSVEQDGANKYYTSWMRVVATHNTTLGTEDELGVNQIRVVLYGDLQVPAQRNFEPCELMTIARWGCIDYSNPSDPDYESVKASIIRRQRMFMISTTEGRVVKYTGVDSPILKNGNYGVTIGELPEFVKNYPDVREVLDEVGEHTDWLYAQGVVVGNFIKVTREGLPVPVIVFCGDWVDGAQATTPTVGAGIYLYNEYNEETQQYETHEVRHNGGRWQCLQHQPVRQGGVDVYYEPAWNSPYWRLVDGNDNLTIEFVSSNGYSFRRGAVDTVITPHVFYGNVDITADIDDEFFVWERASESGQTEADVTWGMLHSGEKTLHLTNADMPVDWSYQNKAIFTLHVTVDDGKLTRIVDNQIVA